MDDAVVDVDRDVDVLAALRGATRVLHESLDRQLPLARPGATLEDYRRHLLASCAWVRALTPWLERAGGGAAAAQRLAWMAADLADCGGLASAEPADAGARVRAADDGSRAHALGVLYVVEGAALGGLVLHKRLRTQLAPHPLRYLAGAGTDTPARWRAVLQSLREQIDGPAAREVACRAAVAAFEDFAAAIAPGDHG